MIAARFTSNAEPASDEIARIAEAEALAILARLVGQRVRAAGTTTCQVAAELAGLFVIVTIGDKADAPNADAPNADAPVYRPDPAPTDEDVLQHYRPLSEAEALIMSSLPRVQQRTTAEIAEASGYSVRYAGDLLAELFREGLVFKGCGGTWLRK